MAGIKHGSIDVDNDDIIFVRAFRQYLIYFRCDIFGEWVNVSSGTGSPGLSRTNSTEP